MVRCAFNTIRESSISFLCSFAVFPFDRFVVLFHRSALCIVWLYCECVYTAHNISINIAFVIHKCDAMHVSCALSGQWFVHSFVRVAEECRIVYYFHTSLLLLLRRDFASHRMNILSAFEKKNAVGTDVMACRLLSWFCFMLSTRVSVCIWCCLIVGIWNQQ